MSEISPEDLRSLVNENAGLAERLEASEAERSRLETSLGQAEAELRALRTQAESGEGTGPAPRSAPASTPPLSPTEVSDLVGRLLAGLDSQLAGLSVRDGELQLKVAFDRTGEKTGFVIPGLESPPEVRETLQTITVRLTPRTEPSG